jgi:signal transduction histidine kinase
MTARAAKIVTAVVWGLTVALVAGGVVLTVLDRDTLDPVNATLYTLLFLAGLLFSTVGALIARRHPRNPIGWLFCLSALAFAVFPFGQEYAARGIGLSPGSLPLANWVGYSTDTTFGLMIGPLVLVFFLYPDGRPLSRFFRVLAWVTTVTVPVSFLTDWLDPHSITGNNDRFPKLGFRIQNPVQLTHLKGLTGALQASMTIALVLAIIAILGLILRLRRSSGVERQQLRWLAYTGAAVIFLVPFVILGGALGNNVLGGIFWFGLFGVLCVGIPIASGIAILKYRLYDLDVVVKKTVVFGALLAFGTLVYLAVVVGIGAAIGKRGNAALTLAAAAIVAIAFQPLRNRARYLADRLVYGKRATPYEVLSEFSDRMVASYSPDDVLPRMAQLLGEGTGAQRAGVWLRVGSEARLAASWPPADGDGSSPATVAVEELDRLSNGERTFPVRDRGEVLGALSVTMPPAEPLTPTQEKLIGDLASQAGLVLRNVRLIEELRASRQRLVAAQDQERRRLERNIHDGAQQQLVAIGVQLGLAQRLAAKEAPTVAELLERLQTQTNDALSDLRDLARGIYPPLLADQGLAAALTAQARKTTLPVDVESNGLGRYHQEAEAAVYFCVLEALQNVAKYAEASRARVLMQTDGRELVFEVTDDGMGFDPVRTPMGSGLQNMADRLAALGGSLDVRSQPGAGTTLTGRIPAAEQPATSSR